MCRYALALRLRHVRELGDGHQKSIPNIVWHSGVVLARWLSRRPELVRGKEVLEIGAGLGAPGMTAAARWGLYKLHSVVTHCACTRPVSFNP